MTPRTEITVVPVTARRLVAGSVYCPRCGWRLGDAASPSIGYLKRCSGCRRALALAIVDATVHVIVEDELPEH